MKEKEILESSGEAETSTRPTMRMCRFISGDEGPCNGPITWALEKVDTEDRVFYVCDAHLAAGVRMAGLPARIDLPNSDLDDKNQKLLCACKSLECKRDL